MASAPLRPQFFVTRPNGTLTALVAVDELPPSVVICGVPRTLQPGDTRGMTSLGIVAERAQLYTLESPNASFGRYENRLAPAQKTWAQAQEPGNTTLRRSKGGQGGSAKKEYCSFWIRRGECDYLQQGCIYKHEMPSDSATLEKLGLREIPRWYREKYGVGNVDTGNSRPRPEVGRSWRQAAPATSTALTNPRVPDVSAQYCRPEEQTGTLIHSGFGSHLGAPSFLGHAGAYVDFSAVRHGVTTPISPASPQKHGKTEEREPFAFGRLADNSQLRRNVDLLTQDLPSERSTVEYPSRDSPSNAMSTGFNTRQGAPVVADSHFSQACSNNFSEPRMMNYPANRSKPFGSPAQLAGTSSQLGTNTTSMWYEGRNGNSTNNAMTPFHALPISTTEQRQMQQQERSQQRSRRLFQPRGSTQSSTTNSFMQQNRFPGRGGWDGTYDDVHPEFQALTPLAVHQLSRSSPPSPPSRSLSIRSGASAPVARSQPSHVLNGANRSVAKEEQHSGDATIGQKNENGTKELEVDIFELGLNDDMSH